MTALLKRKTLGKVQISNEEKGDLEGTIDVGQENHSAGESSISSAMDVSKTRGSRSMSTSGMGQPPQVDVHLKQNQGRDTQAIGQYEEPRSYSGLPDGRQYPPDTGTCGTKCTSGTLSELTTTMDVICRGLLTMHEASRIYDRYVDEIIPHFPIVLLPKGAAECLRWEKPTLFLAVISAAASTEDEDLYLSLNQELVAVYADKITIKGEKSLELIQSMLVSVVWCCPPENFDSLKFYQYIHLAATMALDLGIGKKIRLKQTEFGVLAEKDLSTSDSISQVQPIKEENRSYTDAALVESRRTLLACYLMCSQVSTSLRRPNMLRLSSWMAECIDYLEASPDAAPTDKRFVAWVKLQRLIEECGNALSFDDPSASPSLAESRVQLMLKGFEKQMENWKNSIAPGVMNRRHILGEPLLIMLTSYTETLYMTFYFHNILLHELSLHPDHNPEVFHPPNHLCALRKADQDSRTFSPLSS